MLEESKWNFYIFSYIWNSVAVGEIYTVYSAVHNNIIKTRIEPVGEPYREVC